MQSAYERNIFSAHATFLESLIRETLDFIEQKLNENISTEDQRKIYREMKAELIDILRDLQTTVTRTLENEQ